ncbi:MAG: YggS family pyridoxal phosphate-dependent enzyme [DPANN group archaeon]|nr:YggS family pyridoxal phosphate-dependent enzyme [DPANN group archaeon]
MSIAGNIADVRRRIAEACARSGRDPSGVKLISVTKTVEIARIQEALASGITAIGENRLQEAMDKFDRLDLRGIERHFIGNLQTNKVRSAVDYFDVLQSVETLKVAKEIDKRAYAAEKIMPVFIEVNIGGEESKHGIEPEKAEGFHRKLLTFRNIRVEGLMTVAPLVPAEETRPHFKEMRRLQERLGVKSLSMGMSNDFEVAIEEGSTMVRLGTAIFGQRR